MIVLTQRITQPSLDKRGISISVPRSQDFSCFFSLYKREKTARDRRVMSKPNMEERREEKEREYVHKKELVEALEQKQANKGTGIAT